MFSLFDVFLVGRSCKLVAHTKFALVVELFEFRNVGIFFDEFQRERFRVGSEVECAAYSLLRHPSHPKRQVTMISQFLIDLGNDCQLPRAGPESLLHPQGISPRRPLLRCHHLGNRPAFQLKCWLPAGPLGDGDLHLPLRAGPLATEICILPKPEHNYGNAYNRHK